MKTKQNMPIPIRYIYDLAGNPEYVILPVYVWEDLQKQLQQTEAELIKDSFEPTQFWSCIDEEKLDIDQELFLMRQEWNRDF